MTTGSIRRSAVEKVLLTGPRTLRLAVVDLPELGADQVCVDSVVSGVSHGTEMAWYLGEASALHKGWDPDARLFDAAQSGRSYPVAPGYETVGRVTAVGTAVRDVEPGDLAYIDRPHARAHIVPAALVVAGKLEPGTPAEAGMFFPLARVALGGVHDSDIHIGDAVVVVGLGVVGLLAAALAVRSGADLVVGLDRYPRRLTAAGAFGVDPVDVDGVADPALAVRDRICRLGADIAIEASGSYEGLRQAIRCCRPGGRVVTVGSYHGQADALALGEEYHRNRITLVSSMTVNGCAHRQAPRWDLARLDATARRLIQSGVLPVTDLITHRVPFEHAQSAYQLVAERPETTIKVALTYEP